MERLRQLFEKDSQRGDQAPDVPEMTPDLERREKFLRYLNRGWLALGVIRRLRCGC